jgi:lysophospholipase L1-like esterase
MMARTVYLGLLLLPALAGPARAQDFFFKDGDVVVQMGDSITEQRLYSKYVETWTVTRFPAWKLTFRNVGIGGDRSTGGNSRFKRDVLAYQPTALTVDFGMNDGSYTWVGRKIKFKDKDTNQEKEVTSADIDRNFDVYMKGLQGIADQASAAKIRVAWITPQPIERGEPGPQLVDYNRTLESFSAGVKEIAQKNNGLFVDQFHPYLAVINKARDTDPKIRITAGDAVHPGPPGQALMAASILDGMRFPPTVVNLIIDVNKGVAAGQKCKVTDLNITRNGVRFSQLDRALPYFPEQARSILKWAPLLEHMNHYGLQVKGLAPGRYEIRLGGTKVAAHSAEELDKGVNLAAAVLAAGPIAEQVKAVAKAIDDKTNYFHGQIFRGLILAPAKSGAFKDVPAEKIEERRKELYSERMKRMPELDEAVRQTLVMRPHTVEIVAATNE